MALLFSSLLHPPNQNGKAYLCIDNKQTKKQTQVCRTIELSGRFENSSFIPYILGGLYAYSARKKKGKRMREWELKRVGDQGVCGWVVRGIRRVSGVA